MCSYLMATCNMNLLRTLCMFITKIYEVVCPLWGSFCIFFPNFLTLIFINVFIWPIHMYLLMLFLSYVPYVWNGFERINELNWKSSWFLSFFFNFYQVRPIEQFSNNLKVIRCYCKKKIISKLLLKVEN